jgi:hypothetical protein
MNSNLFRGHQWFYIVLLAVIVFFVYLPGADYAFMLEWDDSGLITENFRLEPTIDNVLFFLNNVTFTQMIFSPTLMYSLMLDRWLFGLNPLGYHLHNIILHCASAILLYGIVRQFGVRGLIAFCVALLWAVHPQRVESVIWITERKDVLAGALSFAAMLVFMRSFDRGKPLYGAVILLLLAMAAKPSTLTLPGIMIVYALYKRQEWKSLKSLIPVVASVIVFYLYSYWVCHSNLTGTAEAMPRLLLVPLYNMSWYLLTAVIPFELNPIYPRVGLELRTMLLLLFTVVIFITGIVLLCKSKPSVKNILFKVLPLPVAWLCCFVPVSAVLVRFTNTDYCDRYNYLLAAVVWAGIGILTEKLLQYRNAQREKTILAIGFISIAAVYLLLTITYIPCWRNTKTLFLRALEVKLPNAKAIEGLGRVGIRNHDIDALTMAGNLFVATAPLRLQDTVNRPRSDYFTGIFFSGMALLKANNHSEALAVFIIAEKAYYDKTLQLYAAEEYLPMLWNGLATCYLSAGRLNDAVRCLQLQQQLLNPNSAEFYFCRGLIAFLRKDINAARQDWSKAHNLCPQDTNIRKNLEKINKAP